MLVSRNVIEIKILLIDQILNHFMRRPLCVCECVFVCARMRADGNNFISQQFTTMSSTKLKSLRKGK
jgi:hypothetical protein